MSKNIVIFCDGTNQKGGKGDNTNVYKLFNMIEDRTQNQIAYYDPGIGTDYRKITGSLFGHGFSKNLLQCYTFLFDNYCAGDKVYLFGFSRGAATVRSLSNFIHLFGVLPKSRTDLIKKAFSIYKKKNRNKLAAKFIGRHHTMWCKVEFLGVWDTVAALGFPSKTMSLMLDGFFKHQFHSFKLSESVKYARHALAIDEERKTFLPVLFDRETNGSDDKLKQVWFSGVHTDIGGGYADSGLSDITLKWMIEEATSKGLLIYKKSRTYHELVNNNLNSNSKMHNEQEGFIGKLFRTEKRSWNVDTHGKLSVHPSVFQRVKNSTNSDTPKYRPWIFDQIKE